MPRNGSGSYSLPAGNPVVTGTTISSTTHNNTNNDIATALTGSIAKDGQTVPTANLPMGTFKLTGLGAGSAAGDSVRFEQISQDLINGICEGRLTLTSGTPVTTGDVSTAETVYFTPYKGNRIAVYDGSKWVLKTFTELSIDVPDAAQMNDVFIYDNAGTLTLELTTWTNDTTRATALTTQNGVLVKTGATTRRYLGSFYSTTDGNGQTKDAAGFRHLWNYYNRVRRRMVREDTTDTWTYQTAAYRVANADAANCLSLVIGVSEDMVEAWVFAHAANDQAAGTVLLAVAIGLDGTTPNSDIMQNGFHLVANTSQPISAAYSDFTGVGKHVLNWLEYSTAAGTTTWIGDGGAASQRQSGMIGAVWA